MADSSTVYRDDPNVLDEHSLWRRIARDHYIEDRRSGQKRVSSGAFCDSSDGSPMSVYLAAIEGTTDRIRGRYSDEGLSEFTARFVRRLRVPQGIHPDPTDEERAHALVFGAKTDAVRRDMAAEATRRLLFPPNMGA
jgi:hypothetical protein